jgi:hypothetical protein
MQCPICENNSLPETDNTICQTCGYSSETKKIDPDSCRNHYQNLKRERIWVKAVEFLGRIEELTRYSRADIGRLTGIAKSTATQDLQLAQGLKDRPELKKITSKGTAFATLNETFKTKALDEEKKLHRNLYNNWDKTPFAKEWELVRTGSYMGKLNTDEIGEIDLLAKSKSGNKWLVIELKKGPGSDKTIGQILRYMGWIKEKKAEKGDIVQGLIICGEYNLTMDYALKCVPTIQAKIYRNYDDKLKFRDFDTKAYAMDVLDSLDFEQKEKVIEQLKIRESNSKKVNLLRNPGNDIKL